MEPGRRRRWTYRVLGMVLVPVLLFAGGEGLLRMLGYGNPTSFFLRRQVNGREVLVENPRFGLRFFPAAMARNPPLVVVPAVKPPDTFRIFLFGESAALGDPEPAYGMGRQLEVMLQARFPHARFEVVCVAMTAVNSHAILPIARECATLQGDLWVIYAGNNEMEGPFGAGTVFGPRAPNLLLVRASLALKATRTGQWLQNRLQQFAGSASTNQAWRGAKMFVANQVAPDDPRRQVVYRHFARNLDDIVRTGVDAGCPVILSTVACNLADCAPFGSLHGQDWNPERAGEWSAWVRTGEVHQASGRFAEAVVPYVLASRLDPRYAEVHYRIGQTLLGAGRPADALLAFERARDCDTLPFRADSEVNAIIRRTGEAWTNHPVRVVDAARILGTNAPAGIPGQECFLDQVHLTFEGNYWLARAFAENTGSLLPGLAAHDRDRLGQWPTMDDCRRRLGYTDWSVSVICESILQRIADAPYTNQLSHTTHRQSLLRRWNEIRERLSPDAVANATAIQRAAIESSPHDPLRHEAFAQFLEAVGDRTAAVDQWMAVQTLAPHYYVPYAHIGRLQLRLGQLDQAERNLSQALVLEPRAAGALTDLGQLRAQAGRWPEAVACYRQALQLQPDNTRIRLYLADVLSQQGQRSEAIRELKQAVEARPGLWEARYQLGIELANSERNPEAEVELTEAVRLKPDHILARLNLGVVLARQGRTPEAQRQFEEVLRLDPDNQPARASLQKLMSTR